LLHTIKQSPLLKINCEEKDVWFVFANGSLHYGECRKNPCLNKKLSDIERRTLVPTRTMLKMLGLPWSNDSSVHLPYEPFWFLDKIFAGECRSTFTSSNSCEKNQTLAFFGTDPEPKCRFVISGCFIPYVGGSCRVERTVVRIIIGRKATTVLSKSSLILRVMRKIKY
jgi:hypothetical protein